MQGVLCAVLLVQVGWTASALRADRYGAYSAEKQVAEFLKPYVGKAAMVGLHYQTIGTNAYFGRSIFANQPTPYWIWSIAGDADRRAAEELAKRPAYVVVSVFRPGDESLEFQWRRFERRPMTDRWLVLDLAAKYGYVETHRFCGDLWMRFGSAERQCEVVLQPGTRAAR